VGDGGGCEREGGAREKDIMAIPWSGWNESEAINLRKI
jgi:hypothetical protein